MDRDAARRAAFALLAVAALAAVAATIDSTVTGGGSGGFGGGGSSDAGGAPPPVIQPATGRGLPAVEPICVPTLARPPVVAGLLLLLAVGHYAVYRRTESLRSVGTAAVAVGFPLSLLWLILVACRLDLRIGGLDAADGGGYPLPVGGGGFGPSNGGGAVTTPTALFGILLLAALAASLALLFVSTGDREAEAEAADESASEAADVRGVGRAAGDAADRIESDADVGNEVYRAWAEMTAHLDVERPESSTPGEFAAAAVDAGMAREDVDELTRLFEEVRYGDERVTESRAEQAVSALRRIESAYAGEEP